MTNKELSIAALCFMAILTAVLTMPVLISSAYEIILSAQQPLKLNGDVTIAVEDVDPLHGMVWMEIYNKSQNGTLNSTVLALGEHFNCSGVDLEVKRIYAGGASDLVSLEINVERNNSRIPSGSPVASL